MTRSDQSTDKHASLLFFIITVASASFTARINTSLVNIALPSIAEHFNASVATSVAVPLSYMLALAGLILISGKLADLLGPRRVYLCGSTLFVGASLSCGLAPGMVWLVSSRFIQGIGGTMLVTSSYALVIRNIDRQQRGRVIGCMTMAASIGMLLGTPLGGFISSLFRWNGIFLIMAPLGLLLLLLGILFLPADTKPKKQIHIDWTGGIISCFFFIVLILTIRLSDWKTAHAQLLFVLYPALLVLGILFFLRERSHTQPILNWHLCRARPFRLGMAATGFMFLMITGTNLLIPFYLQRIMNLRPDQTGLLLTVFPLTVMLTSPLAGWCSDRLTPLRTLSFGLILSLFSTTAFACLVTLPDLRVVVPYLILTAAGFSFFIAPCTHMVLSCAQREQAGSAASLNQLCANLSMAIAVSVIGNIFSALQGDGQQSSLEPYQIVFILNVVFCMAAMGSIAPLWRRKEHGAINQPEGYR